MTICDVARYVGVSDTMIRSIDKKYLQKTFVYKKMLRPALIQVLLKPGEHSADVFGLAQVCDGVRQRVVILQPQQWREFLLVEFFHALAHVMSQDKVEERSLLVVEFGMDVNAGVCCSDFASDSGERVGHVGQYVEEVAFVGVDDALHFGELIVAEAFGGEGFEEFGSCVGGAPDGSQFGFVVEELRQFAEQHFHELLR